MVVATGTTLDDIERMWYSTHLTVKQASSNRIEDLKRAYYIQVLGTAGVYENIASLELRWLRSLTGVTATHNDLDRAWREAVVGAGHTPEASTPENKKIYFLRVS